MNSIKKYTVQCHYSIPAAPSGGKDSMAAMAGMDGVSPLIGLTLLAAKANFVMCVLLVIIGVIHLLNVFVLTPCSTKQRVFAGLQYHGIKPPQGCAAYAFTNLSMVATFSNLNLKYEAMDIPADTSALTEQNHKEPAEDQKSQKSQKSAKETEDVEMKKKAPEADE